MLLVLKNYNRRLSKFFGKNLIRPVKDFFDILLVLAHMK